MRTFAELLTQYMARTGISDSELARAIGVRRQTVFRWKEGLSEHPRQRDDVLRCAAKLRLTPAETDTLLLAAGFTPTNVSPPPAAADASAAPPRVTSPLPPAVDANAASPVRLLQPEDADAGDSLVEAASATAVVVPAESDASLSPALADSPSGAAASTVAHTPALDRPRQLRWVWPALAGILALFVVAGVWAQRNGNSRGTGALPTPQPGQALILLASRTASALAGEGSLATAAVQTGLQRELNAARLGTNTELRELPAVIQDVTEANAARAQSRASVLLWRADTFADAQVGFPDDKQAAAYVVLAAPPAPAASALDALLAVPAALPLPIHASRANEVRALSLATLGQLAMQQGAWERAAAAVNQALVQASQEDEAVASLAFMSGYVNQRSRPADLLSAVTMYSQTIALAPDRLDAYLNRGLAYVRLDQPAQWQADFAGVLARQPDHVGALTAQCWAYALDHESVLALPACDQAITRGAAPWAYQARALARADAGDLAGAAADSEAFLTWLRGQSFAGRETLDAMASEWLRALQAGQNPFDDVLRARLRQT